MKSDIAQASPRGEWTAPEQMTTTYTAGGTMSVSAYEEQARHATKHALLSLIDSISENPDQYIKIMERKEQDKIDLNAETSMFGFVVKSFKTFFGLHREMTASEKAAKIDRLKTEMWEIYQYSYQGATKEKTPPRRSRRLAEKLKNMEDVGAESSQQVVTDEKSIEMFPPAPPTPAIPVAPPLPDFLKFNGSKHINKSIRVKKMSPPASGKSPLRHSRRPLRENFSIANVINQNSRSKLRKTPFTPKQKETSTGIFNHALLEKFRNVRSPSGSPNISNFE